MHFVVISNSSFQINTPFYCSIIQKWTLYDLPSSQFVLLSSLPIERIVVRGGSMSVRQFMQNLLLAAPVKRRWHFSNIRNEDDQLGWDSIGDLLRSNKLIHWTGALLNDMGVRLVVKCDFYHVFYQNWKIILLVELVREGTYLGFSEISRQK